MWLLKNCDNGKLIYLKPNATMTVGRKKGDIVLPEDGSISRTHALITVKPAPNIDQITERSQPLSECIIKDAGSKYGNFILKDYANTNITQEGYKLKHMDRIRFGLQNYIFTVHYIPIITATSGMSAKEKEQLEKVIDAIDGKITNVWISLCTHMTVELPKISEKLSCALVTQTPIVTMDYWNSVAKAVEENEELPDPVDFASLIDNKMSDFGNITVRPKIARQTLFENLTFVHFNVKQYILYGRMIKLAGGKSIQYGKIRSVPNVCDDNVIVVQYVESNTTQATGTGDASYAAVCEKLRECRRRTIPESEIAIAILHCSTEKYCNPNYDYAEIFATRKTMNYNTEATVIALDTQDIDYPSTSTRGRSNRSNSNVSKRMNVPPIDSMICIPETVEHSYDVDSESMRSCDENSSNDRPKESPRNKSYRREEAKISRIVDHSMGDDLPSESEIGSMQLASLNDINYFQKDFNERKTSIDEIPTKRGRANEDDWPDERNKKICTGISSIDKIGGREERATSRKKVQSHEVIIPDDEDVFCANENVSMAEKVLEKKRERLNTDTDENNRKRKIGRSCVTPFSDFTENQSKRKKIDKENEKQMDIAESALAVEKISMDSSSSDERENIEVKEENEWILSATIAPIGSEENVSGGDDKWRMSSTCDYDTNEYLKFPNDPDSTLIPLLRIKSLADVNAKGGPRFGKCFRKQEIIIPVRVELDGSTYMNSSIIQPKQKSRASLDDE